MEDATVTVKYDIFERLKRDRNSKAIALFNIVATIVSNVRTRSLFTYEVDNEKVHNSEVDLIINSVHRSTSITVEDSHITVTTK